METFIDPVEIGKGISDFGFMVITTALYLTCSVAILFFFIRWFVQIINMIIKKQQKNLDEMVQLEQGQKLLTYKMLLLQQKQLYLLEKILKHLNRAA